MTDYISRADLPIKYLTLSSRETDKDGNVIQSHSTTWEVVMKTDIEDLPSADAVHGEWIEVEDDYGGIYWECSNCEDAFFLEVGTPKDNNYNYCPSCGARMKGGAE